MSPRLGVRFRAFMLGVLTLAFVAAPAAAQFYDDARTSLGFSLDPIQRSARLLGMGALTLVGNDPHNRITLWDFAANPTGILESDSISTFELRPGTASLSQVHDKVGVGGERQDLAARETRIGYEAWRRTAGPSAYGVAGEFSSLRSDAPYSDLSERRSRFTLPSAMPVIAGRVPFTESGKWLYAARLLYSGETSSDEFRLLSSNAAGDYIDHDGTLFSTPYLITPDEYQVRSEGGGVAVAWKGSPLVTVSLGTDLVVDDIQGTNNGDRHASEITDKRPYLNSQATLLGRVGQHFEWGIDGHQWSAKSEQRWVFTISAGQEAPVLAGRGKLLDRDEKGASSRARVRWTQGSLELGAGLTTNYRKISVTPPGIGDVTSFNHFRNVTSYRVGADTLDLADSVSANVSEARTYQFGTGLAWRLPGGRGTWGVEYHTGRSVLDQELAGQGPKPTNWDVRTGVEYLCTPVLSGRAGYQYGRIDQDDLTLENERLANTLTLGLGLHPRGTRWSLETGYAVQWTRSDFGDPTQSRSSRQQLASQIRWAF